MSNTLIKPARTYTSSIPDPGHPIDWEQTEKIADHACRFMKVQVKVGQVLDEYDKVFSDAINDLGENEEAEKIRSRIKKARNAAGYWYRNNLGALIDYRCKMHPEKMGRIMETASEKNGLKLKAKTKINVNITEPRQLKLPFGKY